MILCIRKAQKVLKLYKAEEERKVAPIVLEDLRPWQRSLVERLKQRDDRKIIFIVDLKGGRGKGWISSRLGTQPFSQALEMEAKKDMKTVAEVDTQNFFINIPRAYGKENVNYACLEAFKDGMWSSGKYEGKVCNHQAQGIMTQVVVTMNFMPDLEALSADRYEIWLLDQMCNDINSNVYDCIVDNDMKNLYKYNV